MLSHLKKCWGSGAKYIVCLQQNILAFKYFNLWNGQLALGWQNYWVLAIGPCPHCFLIHNVSRMFRYFNLCNGQWAPCLQNYGVLAATPYFANYGVAALQVCKIMEWPPSLFNQESVPLQFKKDFDKFNRDFGRSSQKLGKCLCLG